MTITDELRAARYRLSLGAFAVPHHLRDGLIRHVMEGGRTGGFLTACLKNDFVDAVCRAGDDLTKADLIAIAKWIYNEAPSKSWGSAAAVEQWKGESDA